GRDGGGGAALILQPRLAPPGVGGEPVVLVDLLACAGRLEVESLAFTFGGREDLGSPLPGGLQDLGVLGTDGRRPLSGRGELSCRRPAIGLRRAAGRLAQGPCLLVRIGADLIRGR